MEIGNIDNYIKELNNKLDRGLEKPRVDYNLYMNVFHKYFIDPEAYEGDSSLLIGKWLRLINNNATTPVDLIDSSGNVVYTLPPLANVSTIAMDENNLDIILKQATLKDKYMPGMGNQYYEQAKKELDKTTNSIKNEWDKALEELNKKKEPIEIITDEEIESPTINYTKFNNSDIDDEFDI